MEAMFPSSMKFVLCFAILCGIAVLAQGDPCRGGQVWNNCGSPCTKTCRDPAPACIERCDQRCECPHDKPIWHNNACIKENQCRRDTKCPANQVWFPCMPCSQTCEHPYTVCPSTQCQPGESWCGCPSEKPVLHQKRCITRDHCPRAVCRGGQVWKDCGSPCTKTCADPDPACIEVCEAKCECPPEFPIWDKHSCIEEDVCKRRCPANQVWLPCRPCQRTCEIPFPICRMPPCMLGENWCGCPADKPIWYRNRCIRCENCPEIGPCPYGGPLEDSNGEIFCGRGPRRQDCPPDSHCVIDPLDRYAVCCVDSPQF